MFKNKNVYQNQDIYQHRLPLFCQRPNSCLLINPLRAPQLDSWLQDEHWEWYVLRTEGSPDSHATSLPRLLVLNGKHFPAEKLQQLAEKEAVILIEGDEGTNPLSMASRLAHLATAYLWDGSSVWFRYYEPYVMNALLAQGEEEHLAVTFGNEIERIVIPDIFENVWIAWEYFGKGLRKRQLFWDTKLFESVLESQHAHFVDKMTQELISKYLLDKEQPRGKSRAYVAEALDAAEGFGIVSYDYMRDFVLLAGEAGAYWYKAPQWSSVLEKNISQHAKMSEIQQLLQTKEA